MSWSRPDDVLEDTTSIEDDAVIEKAVSKSYSLPASVHKKVADEAKRRSKIERRRVSASQILLELINGSDL